MDIEKLIEQLRWWADHCDRTNYGCHAKPFLLDAAAALSALQTENERLRDELKRKVNLVFQQAKISIHAPREGCDSKLYQRAESLLGSICLFAQGEEG